MYLKNVLEPIFRSGYTVHYSTDQLRPRITEESYRIRELEPKSCIPLADQFCTQFRQKKENCLCRIAQSVCRNEAKEKSEPDFHPTGYRKNLRDANFRVPICSFRILYASAEQSSAVESSRVGVRLVYCRL